MSLLKLAMSASNAITPLFASIGVSAAHSGNPLKFLAQKSGKASILKTRQKMQRATIATIGNTLNNIRAGKTQDSTRLLASIIDSIGLGHGAKMGLSNMESRYKNNKLAKAVINDIVDSKGRINIPKLERNLLIANKVHGLSTHYAKKKLATNGAMIGFGVGATRGALKEYSNENSDKKSILKHSLKSGIKDAAIGASIGGSLKAGFKKVKNMPSLKNINKVKNIYFKDDYWRKNIQAANENPFYRTIGKAGANLFTADPIKRGVRMARFEALHDFMNQDVRDVFKKENRHKAKRALITTIDSFKSPSRLENKFKINQSSFKGKETKFKDILKKPLKNKLDNSEDMIYEYK